MNKLIAKLGSRANRIIERQDKRIVETQPPKSSDLEMDENLVAADRPIMEYRNKRKQLQLGLGNRVSKSPSSDNAVKGKTDDTADKIGTGTGKETEADAGGENMTDNKAMCRLSYGLFVLTAKAGDRLNGCITNTAIRVASDPNQLSFAVNKTNFTHDMIIQSRKCCISVISEEASFELFKHFGLQSGRDAYKFADFKDFRMSADGIPYITEGTNAYFSIDVMQTVDLGSHTLFMGAPTEMGVLSDIPSATYAYYQSNIKPGQDAKPATSEEKLPEGVHRWRCKICGYEYVGGSLPDDYICPICKHPASDFELVE